MGNQIFIYSFCKKLVGKTNQKAILYFDSEDGRQLEISKFDLDDRICIVKKTFLEGYNGTQRNYKLFRKIIEHLPYGGLQKFFIKIANRFGIVFIPNGFCKLNYEKLAAQKDIIVNGFFQSDKYFADISEQLIKEFKIPNLNKYIMSDDIHSKLDEVSNVNSICIHIRRGDYLKSLYRNRFLVCDEKYYENAIEFMETKIIDAEFYVFSDDIEWVKKNFIFFNKYKVHFINNGGELAVLDDFLIMKECKNFIMSNSTLSWWVQYLSTNKDKIVVAPDRWLNTGFDNRDIYQDNWNLIKV